MHQPSAHEQAKSSLEIEVSNAGERFFDNNPESRGAFNDIANCIADGHQCPEIGSIIDRGKQGAVYNLANFPDLCVKVASSQEAKGNFRSAPIANLSNELLYMEVLRQRFINNPDANLHAPAHLATAKFWTRHGYGSLLLQEKVPDELVLPLAYYRHHGMNSAEAAVVAENVDDRIKTTLGKRGILGFGMGDVIIRGMAGQKQLNRGNIFLDPNQVIDHSPVWIIDAIGTLTSKRLAANLIGRCSTKNILRKISSA